MERLRVLGVVVLVLIVGQAAASQQPTFRAGVNYVRVDVVVTDKNDRPIIDLTSDDFAIVDRGRPQAIDTFQFMSVPIEHRPIDASEPGAPPPDVATNMPPSQNSRVFVLIIDDLHILESNIVAVRKILTDFLQALSPDDEVGIVFTGHSNLSQNITTDRGALVKTIAHVRDALGVGLDALGRPDAGQALGSDRQLMLVAARESDFVLKNVAQALAGSGHMRRAIVYISEGSILPTGFGTGGRLTDFDFLQDAYDAARKADVPIYTIDPRGQPLPEDAVRGGISKINDARMRATIAANIRLQVDRLSEVAINTGGRAFTGQSNLTRAVDEIVSENGSYYVLGYYPTPFEPDGKFHTISVHVKRPGTRVRARAGYVASTVTPSTTDLKPTLDTAMSAGVNVSGIALRAVATPVTVGGTGVTTVVTVEVTYPAPTDGSRHIDDTLQMSVLAVDPDAKVKGSSERTLRFTGTAPGDAPVMFFIDDVVELPAQPLTLKVGIASRALGKAGTVQVPVTVPRLSDSKLQLSGIVLGFAGPPREASMHGDALTGLVQFQPTTTRLFAAGETLRVYSRVFWGVNTSTADVTLTVTGAATIPPKTTTLSGSRGANGHSEGALDVTLPLASLPAGKYVLAIEAHLANGDSARRMVTFEVQ